MLYEAPGYCEEGVEHFKKCLNDTEWTNSLLWFGAYIEHALVGIIATRNNDSHIALFFVKENYHNQGIGRKLFNTLLSDTSAQSITVNSSPYAVEIYTRLGFHKTQDEQLTDGIRYTPMLYTR